MKISRKAKTGCAAVLTALVTLIGLSMQQTYAAEGINLNKPCSITISAADGPGSEDMKSDFQDMMIPVELYRVASVDVTGQNYEANEAFQSIKEDLKAISSDTTADDWMNMAKKAAAPENLAEAKKLDTADQHLCWGTKMAGGTASFSGLTPGMYLLVPAEAYNSDYSVLYQFTPYLTALPSSDYTLSGGESNNDAWNYDTIIGLKPKAVPQTGSLRIVKTLESYNETLEKASFSFRIQGFDGNEEVYNNVASITCPGEDGSYKQEIVISGFPTGLRMIVTEEYTGASYELVSGGMVHDIIVSDAAAGSDPGRWPMAEAQFVNRYNGGNRGGYGVTNHFDYAGETADGGNVWEWADPNAADSPEGN